MGTVGLAVPTLRRRRREGEKEKEKDVPRSSAVEPSTIKCSGVPSP